MKAIKEFAGNKYYKYVTKTWTQPRLSTNNSIQNGFMVFSNWDAYWPNTGEIRLYRDEYVGWVDISMYFENQLKVSKFTFDVHWSSWSYGGGASSAAYEPQLYGSNNGSTWTLIGTCGTVSEGNTGTINVNTSTSYKYYRFRVRQGGWGGEDALTIANMRFYGTYTDIEESTEQDYDLKGGTYKINVFKLDGKLYAGKEGI